MSPLVHRQQLRALLRACLDLPADRAEASGPQGQLVTALHGLLDDLFQQLAELLAAACGLRAELERPGLIALAPGFGLPFHLLDVAPTDDARAALVDLGKRLRRSERGTLALSSFLAARPTRFTLSEHAPAADASVAESYAACLLDPTPDVWAIAISTRGGERRFNHGRPWKPSGSALRADAWLHAGKMDFGHIDFVVRTHDVVSPAAVTTTRNEHSRPETEAGSTWLPRHLSDPFELGRYLRALRSDAARLCAEAPLLALEPALALARLLLLDDEARALRVVLDGPGTGDLMVVEATTRLAARLRPIPELENLVPSPTLPPDIDPARLAASAEAAVRRFLESLDGQADPLRTQMMSRANIAAMPEFIADLPLDDVQLALAVAGAERLGPDALERVQGRGARIRTSATAALSARPKTTPPHAVEQRFAELLAAELSLPGGDVRRALAAVAKRLSEETGDSELARALAHAADRGAG